MSPLSAERPIPARFSVWSGFVLVNLKQNFCQDHELLAAKRDVAAHRLRVWNFQ